MTSTNDGKDVKSNYKSDQKGKIYYIELFKSLESRLSVNSCNGERTQHLCEAWRHIHSLCVHSASNTHPHLLSWVQRHTAQSILQDEWRLSESKSQHVQLEEAIDSFIRECQNISSNRSGPSPVWETQLIRRARWFKSIIPNPWGHSVLKALLNPNVQQPTNEEVIGWLREERGVIFLTRLRQLARAKELLDLALVLASAVMKRARASAPPPVDTLHTDTAADKEPERTNNQLTFTEILSKEAGFTKDVWELLTDMELVLLHKLDHRSTCIELAKQIPLRDGNQLVERLQKRLEKSPRDKKLWKKANEVATLIAQVVIARCMVERACAGAARAALAGCTRALVRLLPAARLPAAAAALAAPAASAAHLHVLADAVREQCKDDRKPFVCELYVRAITAGMNELERLKHEKEKQSDARSLQQTLCEWFSQLGELLADSARLNCECMLTAFSVHPAPAMYDRIRDAPPLPTAPPPAPVCTSTVLMDKKHLSQLNEENNSEFGSWASDSRTQSNLVKTSETLNLKQTQKQANILSTSIFAEGESLGLSAELCQDLTVLLSGPRVKTLSWDMDRETLLENCRTYMERTHGGTRALTMELKYLNLDPLSFQHLPEEEEDENDIFYGIEKGYEHLLEFPIEDFSQDSSFDNLDESDNVCSVSTTDSIVLAKLKNPKNSSKCSDNEKDPLRLDREIKNKKKLFNKESSNESNMLLNAFGEDKKDSQNQVAYKVKSKVGSNDNRESKQLTEQNNENLQKKEKKRERKERKRKEKTERLPHELEMDASSQLNVQTPKFLNTINRKQEKKPQIPNIFITDSDYHSQGNSLASINPYGNNPDVLFDGLFSMDEIKSPNKSATENAYTSSETRINKMHMTNILNENSDFTPDSGNVKSGQFPAAYNKTSQNISISIPINDSLPQTAATNLHKQVTEDIKKLIEFRRQKRLIDRQSPIKKLETISQTLMQAYASQESEDEKAYKISHEYHNTKLVTKPKQQLAHIDPADTSSSIVSNDHKIKLLQQKENNAKLNKNKNESLTKSFLSSHIDETPSQKQFREYIKVHHNASDKLHNSVFSSDFKQIKLPLDNKKTVMQSESNKTLEHTGYHSTSISSQFDPSNLMIQHINDQNNVANKVTQGILISGTTPKQVIKEQTTSKRETKNQIKHQKKGVNNAPNTFARLSYMHKNKQNDIKIKPKEQARKPPVQKKTSVATHLINKNSGRAAYEKITSLQSKGEIVISKVERSIKNINEIPHIIIKKVQASPNALRIDSANMNINNISTLSNKNLEASSIQELSSLSSTPLTQQTTSSSTNLWHLIEQQAIWKPNDKLKNQYANREIKPNNNIQHGVLECTANKVAVMASCQKLKKSYSLESERWHTKHTKKALEPSNEDVKPKSDWKNVMNAIRALKTPNRDEVQEIPLKLPLKNHLNKLKISNFTHVNECVNPSSILNFSNIIPIKSNVIINKEESYKKLIGPTDQSQTTRIIPRSNESVSSCHNFDYDQLDDLIDDDLRQEIGELSSDEDFYKPVGDKISQAKEIQFHGMSNSEPMNTQRNELNHISSQITTQSSSQALPILENFTKHKNKTNQGKNKRILRSRPQMISNNMSNYSFTKPEHSSVFKTETIKFGINKTHASIKTDNFEGDKILTFQTQNDTHNIIKSDEIKNTNNSTPINALHPANIVLEMSGNKATQDELLNSTDSTNSTHNHIFPIENKQSPITNIKHQVNSMQLATPKVNSTLVGNVITTIAQNVSPIFISKNGVSNVTIDSLECGYKSINDWNIIDESDKSKKKKKEQSVDEKIVEKHNDTVLGNKSMESKNCSISDNYSTLIKSHKYDPTENCEKSVKSNKSRLISYTSKIERNSKVNHDVDMHVNVISVTDYKLVVQEGIDNKKQIRLDKNISQKNMEFEKPGHEIIFKVQYSEEKNNINNLERIRKKRMSILNREIHHHSSSKPIALSYASISVPNVGSDSQEQIYQICNKQKLPKDIDQKTPKILKEKLELLENNNQTLAVEGTKKKESDMNFKTIKPRSFNMMQTLKYHDLNKIQDTKRNSEQSQTHKCINNIYLNNKIETYIGENSETVEPKSQTAKQSIINDKHILQETRKESNSLSQSNMKSDAVNDTRKKCESSFNYPETNINTLYNKDTNLECKTEYAIKDEKTSNTTEPNDNKISESSNDESWKNKIIIEELYTAKTKKVLRLKLPNGNIYQATVSGNLKVDINTILTEPKLKSILENKSDIKSCTLNIKQVSCHKSSIAKNYIHQVKQIPNSLYRPIPTDVIDLISDDEDEATFNFETEFGMYLVKSIDFNTAIQHQKKFNQKCMVTLENCNIVKNIAQTYQFIKNNSESQKQNTNLSAEPLNSNNPNLNNKNYMNNVKNEVCVNNIDMENTKEYILEKPEIPDVPKSSVVTYHNKKENQSECKTNIGLNGSNCSLHLPKYYDFAKTYKQLKQICVVNLVRCDNHLLQDKSSVFRAKNTGIVNLKDSSSDLKITQRDNGNISRKRCNSDSILKDFLCENDESRPDSPSLINNFTIQLKNSFVSSYYESCKSEWYLTKKTLQNIEKNIQHPISVSKICCDTYYQDSSTDCDSDLDIISSGIYTSLSKNKNLNKSTPDVPTLLNIVTNFITNNYDMLEELRPILVYENRSRTLKRKLKTSFQNRPINKVLKTNYDSFIHKTPINLAARDLFNDFNEADHIAIGSSCQENSLIDVRLDHSIPITSDKNKCDCTDIVLNNKLIFHSYSNEIYSRNTQQEIINNSKGTNFETLPIVNNTIKYVISEDTDATTYISDFNKIGKDVLNYESNNRDSKFKNNHPASNKCVSSIENIECNHIETAENTVDDIVDTKQNNKLGYLLDRDTDAKIYGDPEGFTNFIIATEIANEKNHKINKDVKDIRNSEKYNNCENSNEVNFDILTELDNSCIQVIDARPNIIIEKKGTDIGSNEIKTYKINERASETIKIDSPIKEIKYIHTEKNTVDEKCNIDASSRIYQCLETVCNINIANSKSQVRTDNLVSYKKLGCLLDPDQYKIKDNSPSAQKISEINNSYADLTETAEPIISIPNLITKNLNTNSEYIFEDKKKSNSRCKNINHSNLPIFVDFADKCNDSVFCNSLPNRDDIADKNREIAYLSKNVNYVDELISENISTQIDFQTNHCSNSNYSRLVSDRSRNKISILDKYIENLVNIPCKLGNPCHMERLIENGCIEDHVTIDNQDCKKSGEESINSPIHTSLVEEESKELCTKFLPKCTEKKHNFNLMKYIPDANIYNNINLINNETQDKILRPETNISNEKSLDSSITNIRNEKSPDNSITLVYKGNSDVILKGSVYEDPVVGTCYIFPMANKVSTQGGTCNNVCDDKTINMIKSLRKKVLDENIGNEEKSLSLIKPKITYANFFPKNNLDDNRMNNKINLKRKNQLINDIKYGKKYKKGKNIDYLKMAKNSAYSEEYKHLLQYCSSIKFSYSIPFHKEHIDVSSILKKWPIEGNFCNTSESFEIHTRNIFVDNEDEVKERFDPNKQTLAEEIAIEQKDQDEKYEAEDLYNVLNFNMGFGEGSGRVIQDLKSEKDCLKISAATLSDVKLSQPFLTTEDNFDSEKSNMYSKSIDNQVAILKRCISFIELRDKVRSFFKKSTVELHRNWLNEDVKDSSKKGLYNKSLIPYDLINPEFCEPIPQEMIVQVVQVGQLPVSAAAQNPVTCDPRVTQVSNASPSQCSVENSSNDEPQSATKSEYTELTTADLSLPLAQVYEQSSQLIMNSQMKLNTTIDTKLSNEGNCDSKNEKPNDITNSADKIKCIENNDLEPLNNVHYSYNSDNSQSLLGSESQNAIFDSLLKQSNNDLCSKSKAQNGSSEKTDQIAHAMNAAGITTNSDTINNTKTHAFVNILSHKMRHSTVNTSQSTVNKTINAMALQQALAQILPPPLNQSNSSESQLSQSAPQVLHIVQGKSNVPANQITIVDNQQNSVINNSNNTSVLHIVQNKNSVSNSTSSNNTTQHGGSFSGLSLVDAGLQQGGNQLLHIVNTGTQKNSTSAQLLKRVNLLTNLANVQGANEQKMVQFVCKSADGKSIQLNAPHQRSMVLRLQPFESSNVISTPKTSDSQDSSLSQNTITTNTTKENNGQQEIKSRSVYEENYAKFIQNSSSKANPEKSTSLPKFNQAFGKQIFQDNNQKTSDVTPNISNSSKPGENLDNQCPNESSINLDHLNQLNSPPLLLRKPPAQTTQSQQVQPNLVQQIKQTITPMNIQTMHGGVIYTRQIPVNIGGGQTINLITVPSTDLIDENGQKQQNDIKFVNKSEMEPSIIKLVPQNQTTSSSDIVSDTENNTLGASNDTPQTNHSNTAQPLLTQMRIKLPMLSKAPQMVSGARVVRPSFFQIQRNVIGGGNQPVYQQLVLTAAPPLGQQQIRLPQTQTSRQVKVPSDAQSSSESQMSSSTLEQLREFDMVLEQVKERSTVQPSSNSNNSFAKQHSTSTDATDGTPLSIGTGESTQQVLYSIGNNNSLNVTYINRKPSVPAPTTSNFARSPDSSGVADSPSSATHAHMPHNSGNETPATETSPQQNQPKPKSSSKSKSRLKTSANPPNAMKINTVPPKTTTQKPLEDEQTTQRILYILAEYKEQVENSPDKDKPAPRRRSNPPSNPGSSKRKKSSSGSRRPGGRDMSPIHGEDTCRTMGSEDSSCGTSQGDCTENCLESHSPQDSPRKVVRKLTFENEAATSASSRQQPPRNVIVADGQTITVARGTAAKPATAVLMPANYILPVSMVKGGQQIAIVTNRGPKILTVGGEGGTTNALLLQRLIGPAGLKPVLARPGVRHVRLPTAALHNLQAFNLATTATINPPDSTVSPAPAPTPPDLVETRATSSPWPDRESQDIKPERGSSPDGSEPWNLPSSADPNDYSYEETVRAENLDRTVLDAVPGRYSPDMEAQRIFDKMFDVDTKKSYTLDSQDDSPRCGYDIDASDCDDKAYQQVVQRRDQRQHRLVSTAALRHKYAVLEHELRLQKSLSEECEDLGVDSPSAAELFPEAELLFAASPGHDNSQHAHTPQPGLSQSGIPQPDMDDQIATDQLLSRDNIHEDRQQELDVSLGLDEGIVTVSEDGMQATIALDQEEFARSHPNTTFHSEPTEDEDVQPFTISGLKGRHITSTIFHAGRAPATVLMTAPQTTVISQAMPDHQHANVKYIDNMMTSGVHNNISLSSVLVKDDGLTKYDSILNDSRELHLSNTASAIVHSNAAQVIRRVCYDDEKRDSRYLIDESDALIAGDDAKMIAEDSSRDATLESMADVDDDRSSPERHAELFWESNSASERSDSRRPLDFSSDSEKCCKSPMYDETNSTDSSGVGTHMRLDSVIKDARGLERSGSADNSSADDTLPPLRTYPPKRLYHMDGEMERSVSGKTRAGERFPEAHEVRRRASGRGVVKRGCHCCNGSPAPTRPKKSRQKKPNIDFCN